jgi:hypothetical protein
MFYFYVINNLGSTRVVLEACPGLSDIGVPKRRRHSPVSAEQRDDRFCSLKSAASAWQVHGGHRE